jgi:hypothetical protein
VTSKSLSFALPVMLPSYPPDEFLSTFRGQLKCHLLHETCPTLAPHSASLLTGRFIRALLGAPTAICLHRLPTAVLADGLTATCPSAPLPARPQGQPCPPWVSALGAFTDRHEDTKPTLSTQLGSSRWLLKEYI